MIDLKKLIIISTNDTFKNNKSVSDSLSVPSRSTAFPGYNVDTKIITLDREDDISQIRLNYSFDSSKYFIFPHNDVALNANFDVAVTGYADGATYNFSFYTVNQSGGTATAPAYTVNIEILTFIAPF